MDEAIPYTLPLEKCADRGQWVGGKALNLGILLGAGMPVPPGFAVTARAFVAFLAAAGLSEPIRAALGGLAAGDLERAERVSAEIRGRIRAAGVPSEVELAVRAAYMTFCAAAGDPMLPVAVRSSAVGEDSAGASFAGQQESYLWVRGSGEVVRHVVDCWSSYYAAPALSYRRRLGLDLGAAEMGVVVQVMVDARASGVLFTLNPVNGDRSKIVIESSFGLGLGVVGGEVNPDRFFVDKVVLRILERAIAGKDVAYRVDRGGGTVVRREVPPEDRALPSLSDEEVVALAALGKRVEAHYGWPQDIEWAVAAGGAGPASRVGVTPEDRLFILQARPETVWSRTKPEPVARPAPSVLHRIIDRLRTTQRLQGREGEPPPGDPGGE
jgi:pyruvate,water dikinase